MRENKADSHAKCNDSFFEDFAWCSVIQSFAGSIIQTVDDDVQLGLSEGAKVRLFGKELSQEAVGIFIGSSFPCAVGMGEINVGIEMCFQLFEAGVDSHAKCNGCFF